MTKGILGDVFDRPQASLLEIKAHFDPPRKEYTERERLSAMGDLVDPRDWDYAAWNIVLRLHRYDIQHRLPHCIENLHTDIRILEKKLSELKQIEKELL